MLHLITNSSNRRVRCRFFWFVFSQLLQTWSEEGEVEDETHQDEPGVGRWTVVVGPKWAVGRVRLVQTSEMENQ